MSRNEKKDRICSVCGTSFIGRYSCCTLECLHETKKAQGDYFEKRKILDFMLENPNISSREIAKIFGVSKSVTERLAYFTDREFVLKEVDENFFEIIDTEEKAYWLGFMYADGYVSQRKNQVSFVVELCLQGEDLQHLYKFKDSLKSNIIPTKKKTKCNGKEYEAYRFAVSRSKMYKDLISKGCVERKSLILEFPSYDIFENKNLIRHFIRGYVDGDGTVSEYSDLKHPHRKSKTFFGVLGTENFLEGILKYFDESNIDYGKRSIYVGQGSKKNIFYLSKSTRKAYNIIDFLYSDCTIYLERKYKKYLDIKKSQDVL